MEKFNPAQEFEDALKDLLKDFEKKVLNLAEEYK